VVGCDGEHEHGAKEMAAKLRVVLMGSEKAGSSENSCGGELGQLAMADGALRA
jgi:hypothetical protein